MTVAGGGEMQTGAEGLAFVADGWMKSGMSKTRTKPISYLLVPKSERMKLFPGIERGCRKY